MYPISSIFRGGVAGICPLNLCREVSIVLSGDSDFQLRNSLSAGLHSDPPSPNPLAGLRGAQEVVKAKRGRRRTRGDIWERKGGNRRGGRGGMRGHRCGLKDMHCSLSP